MDDVNPADDPNNQGEDEFEEAEQEREENLQNEVKQLKPNHQKPENPEMEEHLVVSSAKYCNWQMRHSASVSSRNCWHCGATTFSMTLSPKWRLAKSNGCT